MCYLAVYLGFVVLDPEDLCSSPACEGRVCCDLDQLVAADDAVHLLNLSCGTLIAPDDGGTEHLVILVQHNKTVHLTGDTDTLYVFLLNAALSHNSLDGLGHGICPVSGILLCIAVLRLVHGVFYRLGGDNCTLFVKEDCLGTAGTAVHAYNI